MDRPRRRRVRRAPPPLPRPRRSPRPVPPLVEWTRKSKRVRGRHDRMRGGASEVKVADGTARAETLTPKGAATRQRIVEAASAEIREFGVTATLDDIRARARAGKGQLFHSFPGGREQLS